MSLVRTSRLTCLPLFAVILTLAACGRVAHGSGQHTFDTRPGAIVLQYFEAPGFAILPFSTAPRWTLYGDGTVIYLDNSATPDTAGSRLVQAQLSASEMQQLLDLVVDQKQIFASSKLLYGKVVPDAGNAVLQATADGQHVAVAVTPIADDDPQTQRLLDIRDYLATFQSPTAQSYAISGIALAAYALGAQSPENAAQWRFPQVDLAAVAEHECDAVPPAICYPPARLVPFSGDLATDITAAVSYGQVFKQNGATYRIYILPLLPDSLESPDGASQVVHIAQGTDIVSIPLSAPS